LRTTVGSRTVCVPARRNWRADENCVEYGRAAQQPVRELHPAHRIGARRESDSMSEALLARRKLGNELLRLREDAGWTQAQMGKLLWTSGTTVHRMEQGRSQIKGPQIGALLRGLAIDDPKLEARLVRLAELSQESGQPYDEYRESLSNEALQFFGHRAVATPIAHTHL